MYIFIRHLDQMSLDIYPEHLQLHSSLKNKKKNKTNIKFQRVKNNFFDNLNLLFSRNFFSTIKYIKTLQK